MSSSQPPSALEFLALGSPRLWLEGMLEKWLAVQPRSSEAILLWVQGVGFPPGTVEEEPYRRLLIAMGRGAKRAEARYPLAEAVRALLVRLPDLEFSFSDPDEATYNLLLFAGGLDAPDVLFESLWDLYQGLVKGERPLQPMSRRALLAALSHNQIDDRVYESVALPLLHERKHPCLPGNEYDGWSAVLRKGAPGERGRPDLAAIFSALNSMAKWLEPEPNRLARIDDLITEASRVLVSDVNCNAALISNGLTHALPDWVSPGDPAKMVVFEGSSRRRTIRSDAEILSVFAEQLSEINRTCDAEAARFVRQTAKWSLSIGRNRVLGVVIGILVMAEKLLGSRGRQNVTLLRSRVLRKNLPYYMAADQ